MIRPLAPTRRAVTAGLGLLLFPEGRAALANTPHQLTARPKRARLRPDAAAEAELWTLEGATLPGVEPGVAMRQRAGSEVRLRVVNETPKPLSLHWHGMRGSNAADGVGGLTQEPIRPGASANVAFTPPDPGTYLIRSCTIGGSAEPAERGLSGLLIVEEPTPPQVDRDIPLLVDDWLLTQSGDLAPFEAQGAGRLGNWLTVNGAPVPLAIEAAPGSRLRLRLANACNARTMRLTFDGLRAYVAAIDSQPTDTFEPLRASVPFAPGSRYDFLVDLAPEAGATGSLVASLGNGLPLLTVTTKGTPRAALPPIRPLPPNASLPPAIRLQDAVRRDLVIRGSEPGQPPTWTINGRPGAVETPLMKVKRGQPVVLALKNETPLPQPIHLHGHSFRLLHPFDDGWEPYWLDTMQIPENRTVRIAFHADNPGKWLLASTVMERFDRGLWTWIEVA